MLSTSLVILALVFSGALVIAFSSTSVSLPFPTGNSWKVFKGWSDTSLTANSPRRLRGGFGCQVICGPVEVSEEFKSKVIDIVKADQDVQNLLNNGYNITVVKPVVKTVVEGDGEVVMKATGAIVMLVKDRMSHATVKVDLENAKVTEVTILTRTVIEKP